MVIEVCDGSLAGHDGLDEESEPAEGKFLSNSRFPPLFLSLYVPLQ